MQALADGREPAMSRRGVAPTAGAESLRLSLENQGIFERGQR